MSKIKLSQSLIKSLFAYKMGEKCGKQIEAQYVDGVQFPSTDAMELGNYFEYLCTGSLARDGHTPEAVLTKQGKPTSKYKLIQEQKANFDNIMDSYGFTISSIDHHFKSDIYSGIADIIAERNGQKCIIDVKTSGLLEDKRSDYGWHNDFVMNNDNLMIQARHYKMLAEEEFGIENIPFYFMVFSTTNAIDCKVFEVDCPPESLDLHKRNSEGAKRILDDLLVKGFNALPNMKNCLKCPLSDKCDDYTNIPQITQIEC